MLDPLQVLIRVALVPAGVVALFAVLARGRASAGPLAVGAAWVALCVGVVGWPAWPMVASTQKLWLAGLLGAGVALWRRPSWRQGLWVSALAHGALFGWVFFRKVDDMGLIDASLTSAVGLFMLAVLGGLVRPKSAVSAAPMLAAAALLSAWQLHAGSFVLSFLAGGLALVMATALAGGLKPADIAGAAVAPLGFCVYTGYFFGGLPAEAVYLSWFLMAACARR